MFETIGYLLHSIQRLLVPLFQGCLLKLDSRLSPCGSSMQEPMCIVLAQAHYSAPQPSTKSERVRFTTQRLRHFRSWTVVDLLDTCVLWPSRAASMEPSKQTSNTVRLSSGSSTETLPSTSDALAVFTRPEAEAVDPTSCPRWTDLGQEAGSYAGWLTRFRGLWQFGHWFQRPGLGRQGVQRSH